MVTARLMNVPFTMTLHGSDILLDPAYLDLKLEFCEVCVTISEFNRQYLLSHYPKADPAKVVVHRLGADCDANRPSSIQTRSDPSSFIILAAGRLHPVKDHAFLLRACRELKARGLQFTCLIAGEGRERRRLQQLILDLELSRDVRLLGQVSHDEMHDYYEMADLVVLTSRSEGLPLVLMEAMAHEKIVLAPEITAIPELVSHGETGFLYRSNSLEAFVAQVERIHDNRVALGPLGRAARMHVQHRFDQQKNLTSFCDRMIATLGTASATDKSAPQETVYEDPVLQ
jgi:colanic acid/amylovoran biosynthesis glycosyltransferase